MAAVIDAVAPVMRFFSESAWARRMGDPDVADFVFGNPVSFFGGMNPDFFNGTVVEGEARSVIGAAK